MSYQPTALRARPRNFDQLLGQEFVSQTLRESLRSREIAHAYLFSGPRGVGKTSAARILAYRLNWREEEDARPEAQEELEKIRKGLAMDIIEIDGASNTSVNDVRQIREEVLFPPQHASYKVYIIDEVHMLSRSAFNALLKTIEEPPPYIVFIFATTELQKVPATVRSRCQHFHFRLIPLPVIRQALSQAAQVQHREISEEVLLWIAKEARGSLRDAYTLFDQISSYREGLQDISQLQKRLGTLSTEAVLGIVQHIADGQIEPALRGALALVEGGSSIEQLLEQLGELYHALLLCKYNINDESLLGISASHLSPSLIARYQRSHLEALLDELLEGYRRLRYTIHEQYELELLIAKLCFITERVEIAEIQRTIAQLEEQLPQLKGLGVTMQVEQHIEQQAEQPIEKQVEQQPLRQPLNAPPAAPSLPAKPSPPVANYQQPSAPTAAVESAASVAPPPSASSDPVERAGGENSAIASVSSVSDDTIPPEAPHHTTAKPNPIANDPRPDPIKSEVSPHTAARPIPPSLPNEHMVPAEQVQDIIDRLRQVRPLLAIQLARVKSWEQGEEVIILRVDKNMIEELIMKDQDLVLRSIRDVTNIQQFQVIAEEQPIDRQAEELANTVQTIFQGERV